MWKGVKSDLSRGKGLSYRQGEALGMFDGLLMSIAFEHRKQKKKCQWDRYRDLTSVPAFSSEHPTFFLQAYISVTCLIPLLSTERTRNRSHHSLITLKMTKLFKFYTIKNLNCVNFKICWNMCNFIWSAYQLSGVALSGLKSRIYIRVSWSLGCNFYYYVFLLSIQEHCCGQPIMFLYFVFIFKFKIPLIEVYRDFYLGENTCCYQIVFGCRFQ